MNEPDVTLTDYGLALECALFARLLWRGGGGRMVPWMVAFFAGVALASLAGGTVHGFFPEESSPGHRFFWSLSLLAIGGTALAGWVLGAGLLLPPPAQRWVLRLALLQLILYGGVVLAWDDSFRVAILDYLPASLFLLVAFAAFARRNPSGRVWLGVLGMLLTFVSAAVQQLGIALHPVYFNHNAFYHLIQALALALIFLACRSVSRIQEGGPDADPT